MNVDSIKVRTGTILEWIPDVYGQILAMSEIVSGVAIFQVVKVVI